MSGRNDIDRIDPQRAQLSALIDGELATDEARFLLRRLEHDGELAGCWERWQLCGDVLRGQAGALLPTGFADRVAEALRQEPAVIAAQSRSQRRWLAWGGGAVAAAAAAVALLVARPGPDAGRPTGDPSASIVANAPIGSPALPTVPAVATHEPATPAPSTPKPDTASRLASAVAVAEVPRRAAMARRSRGQSQRAALRTPAQEQAVPALATAAALPVQATPNPNPFATAPHDIQTRPWPRALLPANGAFTVDYGNGAGRPTFYPFEPGMQVPRSNEERDDPPPQ
jgi:negative regulator of sigma E activity